MPFAGAYTLDLPPDAADPSGPGGDSITAVTVDASGNVRLAGTLADGTKLARAVPLSKDGLWPLYASLYTGKGVVLGWLMFTNGSDADLSGRVSWIKQPLAPGRFYPNGFTSESLAVGSTYHPPNSATSGIVTFTNGVVALRGGDITASFSNHVRIGANSRVTNLGTNRLTLTFYLRTGLWTGAVIDPASGRRLTMNGAVMQRSDAGIGFFLGLTASGQVLLRQAP